MQGLIQEVTELVSAGQVREARKVTTEMTRFALYSGNKDAVFLTEYLEWLMTNAAHIIRQYEVKEEDSDELVSNLIRGIEACKTAINDLPGRIKEVLPDLVSVRYFITGFQRKYFIKGKHLPPARMRAEFEGNI